MSEDIKTLSRSLLHQHSMQQASVSIVGYTADMAEAENWDDDFLGDSAEESETSGKRGWKKVKSRIMSKESPRMLRVVERAQKLARWADSEDSDSDKDGDESDASTASGFSSSASEDEGSGSDWDAALSDTSETPASTGGVGALKHLLNRNQEDPDQVPRKFRMLEAAKNEAGTIAIVKVPKPAQLYSRRWRQHFFTERSFESFLSDVVLRHFPEQEETPQESAVEGAFSETELQVIAQAARQQQQQQHEEEKQQREQYEQVLQEAEKRFVRWLYLQAERVLDLLRARRAWSRDKAADLAPQILEKALDAVRSTRVTVADDTDGATADDTDGVSAVSASGTVGQSSSVLSDSDDVFDAVRLLVYLAVKAMARRAGSTWETRCQQLRIVFTRCKSEFPRRRLMLQTMEIEEVAHRDGSQANWVLRQLVSVFER
ncbi:MAG: hypothetical protein MHM6MM_007268, partial [Cercozoa sp. M6MM]